MTIKKRLKWIEVLVASILAFPFVLATWLLSMLALGIYYLAKAVLMPAFVILRIVRPPNDGDYKWLKNPIITLSDWLLDKADWKL
jgi:hypothetical protein